MNDYKDHNEPGRIATVKFGNANNKLSSTHNNFVSSVSDNSLLPEALTNHQRHSSDLVLQKEAV